MYKLKDTALTPACGWVYIIPETKIPVGANSFEELLEKTIHLYEINKRQLPKNLEDLIHNYICKQCPTGFCVSFTNRMAFTARTLMNGTNALAVMMRLGKGAFVSLDIAEERAKICADCTMNTSNPGCYTCKGFETIINGVRHGRSTPLDSKLNVCGICGCFIKALVHVDIGVLRATTHRREVGRYPEHCWKRKLLEEK